MSGGGARSLQSHEADASPSVNISARRMGEDLETIKSRLIDREFNIKKYPDPLKPREQTKQRPQDISAEDERRWLMMIKAAKTQADLK